MDYIVLERIEKILIFLLIFLTGFFSAQIFSNSSFVFETPLSSFFAVRNVFEEPPSDFISEDNILIYPDKIVINVPGATISRYEATGSMRPVLDKGANGIRIKPPSEDSINVGDIVSFQDNNYLVVHRVIEKGIDENGIYFITKGDNNNFTDGKIRFKDIRYITVGLIY